MKPKAQKLIAEECSSGHCIKPQLLLYLQPKHSLFPPRHWSSFPHYIYPALVALKHATLKVPDMHSIHDILQDTVLLHFHDLNCPCCQTLHISSWDVKKKKKTLPLTPFNCPPQPPLTGTSSPRLSSVTSHLSGRGAVIDGRPRQHKVRDKQAQMGVVMWLSAWFSPWVGDVGETQFTPTVASMSNPYHMGEV